MSIAGYPLIWLLQDFLVLVVTVFTLRHAARHEQHRGQTLLEFFAFTFFYAAVFENGATWANRNGYQFYDYGRSLLMLGNVPFSVPALEYLVVYAALRMLEKMRLATWAKPFIVGAWGMLQDLTLDPLAVRQVFASEGRSIGRWSWTLRDGDVNIFGVPVFNFPGWALILGLGSAFLLLGRWWFERSGQRAWVGVAYPFLAALAGLIALVLPSSQLILWLAPVFSRGSTGEWIMLAVHFAVPALILTFVWRGRMLARLTLRDDWPVLVVPGLFHAADYFFALAGGFTELLPLALAVTALHLLLLALVWGAERQPWISGQLKHA